MLKTYTVIAKKDETGLNWEDPTFYKGHKYTMNVETETYLHPSGQLDVTIVATVWTTENEEHENNYVVFKGKPIGTLWRINDIFSIEE